MQLLLHIGTEKTGTTTLQRFLSTNRNLLEENRTAYLALDTDGTARSLATACMNLDRSDDDVVRRGMRELRVRRRWIEATRSRVARKIAEMSDHVQRIIISSEHFHSRLPALEEVQRVREFLDPHFEDIRVVVYLRSQVEMAVSLFSTAIRVGWAPSRILPPDLGDWPGYYELEELLSRWATVLGEDNLIVRRFGRDQFVDGSLVADFLDAAEITSSVPWIEPRRLNEKLSSETQRAILLYNRSFPFSSDVRQTAHVRAMRASLINELNAELPGRSLMPSRAAAAAFDARFTEANEVISRRFFSGEPVFSNDFSHFPERASEMEPGPDASRLLVERMAAYLLI